MNILTNILKPILGLSLFCTINFAQADQPSATGTINYTLEGFGSIAIADEQAQEQQVGLGQSSSVTFTWNSNSGAPTINVVANNLSHENTDDTIEVSLEAVGGYAPVNDGNGEGDITVAFQIGQAEDEDDIGSYVGSIVATISHE